MPGGRLTQHERQQIALGLADGLAYAEIARRVDRPTSTITREVLRNGGPTTYRAELAHRATERRAHRRRHAAARGPEAAPQPPGRDGETLREYEEMFTTIVMQSGLPKMASRVLVCLYTTDSGSLTAVPARPAARGQPGVRLQGDRLPRGPRPRPPGTRRTPPRALRRRRRRLVPVDAAQRSGQRPARRHGTAGRRHPRPRNPGRRPPREHRPLPRLRQREHHQRCGAGSSGPVPRAEATAGGGWQSAGCRWRGPGAGLVDDITHGVDHEGR